MQHTDSPAAKTTAQVPAEAPQTDPLGNVRVTRHVLASIIELATLSVAGVARLAPTSSPWSRILTRVQPQRGLAITIQQNNVSADLYLILKPGYNMAHVGREVQDAVAAAIEQMLGMHVGTLNVYIQDIA